MPFGLIIGTERAVSLQNSIQNELTKRGYSPDADPVMAEYITIMIINNKTPAQITSELEDLIGSDYDPSFTDWLFIEAAKGVPESEGPSSIPIPPAAPAAEAKPTRDPPHAPVDPSRRPPNAPRPGAPPYQQAIASAISSASPSSQKRTASARSPSPTGQGPSKARRTDLPTGPRAMQSNSTGRSLLDRVGGRNGNATFARNDEIQARIDAVTNGSTPDPSMMMPFQNGMEMAMSPNPLMLQDMMMNQMALMAQMATSMGMLNPGTGQMMAMNGGFPMQQGDMAMYAGGMNGHSFGQNTGGVRGRGGATRGGRGRGGGRGGHLRPSPAPAEAQQETVPLTVETSLPAPIAAPVPVPAQSTSPIPAIPATPQRIPYALPDRPLSPTLCKFGTKCTNSQCRFSHPSPVATAESGVVLSTEPCEKGKECKDKDCIKSHVSPATNNPAAPEAQKPVSTPLVHAHPSPLHPHPHPSTIPCRFGSACTRPGCLYSHPRSQYTQPCRFGAACTRATCPFQHPEGRVLPSTFHRGLGAHSPMVNVTAPPTGSIGVPSPHRSMTFNKGTGNVKDKLEKQIKDIEVQKKAVAEAEAAAGGKGETKSVPIAV
ncbi:hypothetical protein F5J12DRAFT_830250 [Pisolithus orientalis]|uniref:uncharacterized protein n=1 Tax=Pisolithus orientalis TaxID=936130 RepID=UPI0022242BCB|nr:uncharacterized protein F5J12DRAFT_830250 [Pisolithus orientalis]KAI6007713.1 hypothetical protein F5J12DRAFT_830250 [Pisolithus orientalis]